MTEDEAKTKWCPFVRYISGAQENDPPANRWGKFPNPTACRCIASACMMWVTTEGHNKQGDCGLKKSG